MNVHTRVRPTRSLAALAVATALLVTLVAGTAHATTDAELRDEHQFVRLLNAERTARGVAAVDLVSDLVAVARDHTADMARTRDLHHNPDLGDDVEDWERISENVGYSSMGVDSLHDALMASAGHRANILDTGVSQVGVGVLVRDGLTWVTQVFRRPNDRSVTTTIAVRPETTEEFVDVRADSTHAADIVALVDADVTSGCRADHYCPGRGVRRGELATFLARSLGLDPVAGSPFSDISPSSAHAGYIAALHTEGLTDGCGGGRYCPNAVVTRGAMATFLANALDLADRPAPFRDVSPTSAHYGSVGAVELAGITSGCTSERFCPSGAVTRAQLATFLVRAFDL